MKAWRDGVLAAALAAFPIAAAPPGDGGGLRRLDDMPGPRAAHSATRLGDGRVLIAGGCDTDGCEEGLATDALLFDPATARFRPTGAPLQARAGHRAVPLKDGSVLLIGGWTADGVTASIERYSPATGTFERQGRLLRARDGFTATALRDGTILIAGGYADGMRRMASAERYDPRRRMSEAVADMAVPRMSHSATLLDDGRVVIAGGSDTRGSVVATLETFDPATARFTAAGRLRKARHKHAALRVGGDVMLLGGTAIPESDGHFADTEVWSAATGRVRPGPRMRESRYKFVDSVVALEGGRALVSGGGRNAELLSADGRGFRPVSAPIGDTLAFATATPLADRRILIVGGYDRAIRVNHGAWIFE